MAWKKLSDTEAAQQKDREEHEVLVEQARVSTIDAYLSSEDHAKSMMESNQRVVQAYLSSDQHKAYLGKVKKEAYQEGQDFNVSLNNHVGALDHEKWNEGVSNMSLMATFPSDPYAIDLPGSDNEDGGSNTETDADLPRTDAEALKSARMLSRSPPRA